MRVKTYSEEEKMAYVEEFKNSGMGSTTFAREKGIPESTLRTWLNKRHFLTRARATSTPEQKISSGSWLG